MSLVRIVLAIMPMSLCGEGQKLWEAGMESKELHVNMRKTKFLISSIGLDVIKSKHPALSARMRMGNIYIDCSQCKLWVHMRCSGITGRLVANPNYVCPRCHSKAQPIDHRPVTKVEVSGTMIDVEAIFC